MIFINNKLIKVFHVFLNVVTTVMCMVAGLCLIAACVDIYTSGDKPFSAEAVAQRFDVIDVPVYMCLAVIALGFLFSLFFQSSEMKNKAQRYSTACINSLYKKADTEKCDIGLAYVVKTQRKKRFVLLAVLVALTTLGTLVFFVFAFNSANYKTQDVNSSVIKLSLAGLICLAPALVWGIACEYMALGIRRTEGEALRKIISAGNTKQVPADCYGKRLELGVKLGCIAVAAAFIAYGFATGGSDAVLGKAVNLCMECVGLG